jgi:DDE superfamily endonuclease
MAAQDFRTPAEVLELGLLTTGYTQERIAKNKPERLQDWFQASFGCSSAVVSAMWSDLQTTGIDDARIGDDADDDYIPISIYDFLNTLEFLKCYQPEKKREGMTNLSAKTLRARSWYYCRKLQELKHEKVLWPDNLPHDTIWVMTVDGTHVAINEPLHPEFSQDKKYFSHKKNRAGWVYEVGISLFTSNLIWMNGPHKAGANDKTIFTLPGGLKEVLAQEGVKAIGDKFYNGHQNEVSTFNAHDSAEVKKFKSRALKRHENFNAYLKQFAVLDGRFRHRGPEKFSMCFEAVAVISQYRLEFESPLYDM